jgi:N-alpha-acetyl-L-2,4-diaminobutyrate deacetylase
VRNLLIHAGILAGELEIAPTRHLSQPDDACFHFTDEGGLLEFLISLGDPVRAGDSVARIWPMGRIGAEPRMVQAQRDGLLMARHHPGICQAGDCIAVLAVEH